MSTIGNEAVSKNSGADVAVRRRINFIEGANVTLTIVDDPANHEINVTIASAGAAAELWVYQFFPAVDPDSNRGTYPSVLMANGVDVTVRQLVVIPDDVVTVTSAEVVFIPLGNGNIRRGVATSFAQMCAGETYTTHTDSMAAGQEVVVFNDIECIDITAALTGAAGGDIVGVEFTRYGSDGLDTIGADVHYLGILIKGNP